VTLKLRLLLAMGYVLVLALIGLELPLARNVAAGIKGTARVGVQQEADLAARMAADLIDRPQRRGDLQRLADRTAASLRAANGPDPQLRVIVVGADGHLLADSMRLHDTTSYTNRGEVAEALDGRPAQLTRQSKDLNARIDLTAVPIRALGRPRGALRITQSALRVERQATQAFRASLPSLLGAGLIVLALGLLAAILIARQIATPLRDLEAAAQRIRDGDLTARASVAGSREQRLLARAFNEMTDRLERMLRSQQAFVANASHQLRTPLTGLRLRLELLRGGDDGPERAEHIEAGIGEIERLEHITDELLVLSRLGHRPDRPRVTDLNHLVPQILERWWPAAARRNISLRYAASEQPAPVACSPEDLLSAVDVLIENALSYSPPHSTVVLRTAPGVLEVLDEGPGLARGEEDSVFERFSRGSAGREAPHGAGLGLAIARELARRWGGTVTLDNRPDRGARARITLPPASSGQAHNARETSDEAPYALA
jgi:two-component system, OmpR family, sensor kinase